MPPPEVLPVDGGVLGLEVRGRGEPVVVGLHGAGAAPAEVADLLAPAGGTAVLPWLRGHGPSVTDDGRRLTWARLADDLRRVLRASGARRAVGVSIGAATVLRLLAEEAAADRAAPLEAVVLLAPVVLDEPAGTALPAARRRVEALQAAARDDDLVAVQRLLASDVPEDLRDDPAVRRALAERAARLVAGQTPSVLGELLHDAPLDAEHLSALGRVRVRATVVGQEGDALHPAAVARRYADVLPGAVLHLHTTHAPFGSDRAAQVRLLADALR